MEPRYHLWLKPSGKPSHQFAQIIQELALKFQSPTFPPHITLLGNVEGSTADCVAKSTELAQRLSAFPIHVRQPAFGEDYFHCVSLVAEPTPPLVHAHMLARELFRQDGAAPYRPHLSLLYGTYPEDRKKDIIAKLPATLCLPFEASHVSLIKAGRDAPKDWEEVWVRSMGDE